METGAGTGVTSVIIGKEIGAGMREAAISAAAKDEQRKSIINAGGTAGSFRPASLATWRDLSLAPFRIARGPDENSIQS